MSSPIVEQLANGLKVRCADGSIIHCTPITLADAMPIIDFRRIMVDESKTLLERGNARMEMVRRFATAYPDLAQRISAGDVEVILPDFFWGMTGATVETSEASHPPGTSSSSSMLPAGEEAPS